ncbi:MAG: hypothetical protein ABI142_02025, partial [Bryocella sp.]
MRSEFWRSLGASEVPFDQIVQISGARHDPSYHPLIQTFFSFLPPVEHSPAGWEIQPKLVDTGCA